MLAVIEANDVGQPRFRARPVIGILRTWQIDGVADATLAGLGGSSRILCNGVKAKGGPVSPGDFLMPGAKHASKRKRWSKAVPVLGAAGLLSLGGGALARAAGAAADVTTTSSATHHACTLSEEEVSDVSLATFCVFDNERAGRPAVRLAAGCACCQFAQAPSAAPGNDTYAWPPPRPVRPAYRHVRKKP